MKKWNHMSISGGDTGFKVIPALLGSVKHLTRAPAKATNK